MQLCGSFWVGIFFGGRIESFEDHFWAEEVGYVMQFFGY